MGERERLPLSHPDDTRLPMIMFFVMVAFLVWVFVNRDQISTATLVIGTAVLATIAGIMFANWLRD